jgi:hypothetical protein
MPLESQLPSLDVTPLPASENGSALIRAGIGPRHPFPHDRTVLDLFHLQVSARPDRPAVRSTTGTPNVARVLQIGVRGSTRTDSQRGPHVGGIIQLA